MTLGDLNSVRPDSGPWLLFKFVWVLLFVLMQPVFKSSLSKKKKVVSLIFDLDNVKSEVPFPDLLPRGFMTLNNHFISFSFLICRKVIIKSFLSAGYKDEMRYPMAISQSFEL